jgi:sigma-B regulation protein RsbU (phosphoserine phosphatase)
MRREVDVQLTLAARPSELRRVREMVGAIAATLGVEGQRADSIMLAVDEACANVVAHAYREDEPDGVMHVRAHTQADEIVFVVSDNGSPIVKGKSTGAGLGLRLIDSLSDELEIEGPGKDGTRLTIHFHLPG